MIKSLILFFRINNISFLKLVPRTNRNYVLPKKIVHLVSRFIFRYSSRRRFSLLFQVTSRRTW
jgi:hypothetical protein